MAVMATTLTERQRSFAECYLAHAGNGAAAAIAAGYSQTTAAKRASELLRHPEVSRIIKAERAALRSRTDPVDVAHELADLYRSCRAAGHNAVAHQCLATLARVQGVEAPTRHQFATMTADEMDWQIARYEAVIGQQRQSIG